MAKSLLDVLKGLDPKDNTLWTADGLPRLDVLGKLMGGEVTRQQINEAIPGLNRTSLDGKITLTPDPARTAEPEKTKAQIKEEKKAKATLAELEAAVNEADVNLVKAQVALEAAQKARDKAIIEEDGADEVPPHVRNQMNIQAFLASEQKAREARTAK